MKIQIFSLALLAVTSACTSSTGGDGTGNGGGGGGGTIAVTDLYATLIESLCTKLVSCPGGAGQLEFANKDACKAIFTSQFDKNDKLQSSIAAGKIKYDGSKAGACISAMTATCDAFTQNTQPAECKATVTGLVVIGQACISSDECADGYCKKEGDCPGICTAKTAKDGDCTQGGVCADGLHCVKGKCSDSGWGGTDGGCNQSSDCASTAYCDYSSASPTCKTKGDSGAKCNAGASCKSGFTCSKGACTAVAKVGEPCSGQDSCESGAACAPDATGNAGVCVKVVELGGACKTNSECRTLDAVCLGADGAKTCKVLPGKGEACGVADQVKPLRCMPPYTCDGKNCVDPLPKGSACEQMSMGLNSCATGLVCTTKKVCSDLPTEGQPCEGECASGFTCGGVGGGGGPTCSKVVCK